MFFGAVLATKLQGFGIAGGAVTVVALVIIGFLSGIATFSIWIIVVANRARREILEDGEMLPISQPYEQKGEPSGFQSQKGGFVEPGASYEMDGLINAGDQPPPYEKT